MNQTLPNSEAQTETILRYLLDTREEVEDETTMDYRRWRRMLTGAMATGGAEGVGAFAVGRETPEEIARKAVAVLARHPSLSGVDAALSRIAKESPYAAVRQDAEATRSDWQRFLSVLALGLGRSADSLRGMLGGWGASPVITLPQTLSAAGSAGSAVGLHLPTGVRGELQSQEDGWYISLETGDARHSAGIVAVLFQTDDGEQDALELNWHPVGNTFRATAFLASGLAEGSRVEIALLNP